MPPLMQLAPLSRRRAVLRTLSMVVLAALLVLPGTARAAAPAVETVHVEGQFPFGACPSGVTLQEPFTFDLRITTFVDDTGTTVRVHALAIFTGVVTNPVTDQSVRDLGRANLTFDAATGTTTITGLGYTSTIPGVGIVIHDVGRLVTQPDGTVVFEDGPHEVFDGYGNDPSAAFCAILG